MKNREELLQEIERIAKQAHRDGHLAIAAVLFALMTFAVQDQELDLLNYIESYVHRQGEIIQIQINSFK